MAIACSCLLGDALGQGFVAKENLLSLDSALGGKLEVKRSVDEGGLAHYSLSIADPDTKNPPRPGRLREAILFILDEKGDPLLRVPIGLSRSGPSGEHMRLELRFSLSTKMEDCASIALGTEALMRTEFNTYRLLQTKAATVSPEKKASEPQPPTLQDEPK